MNSGVSVIIIAKNEEANIRRCLDSVLWAEEVVVVDSGSCDRTPDICRSYGNVKYYDHQWEGFGRQKNIALDLASSQWILSLDADEAVTPGLADEIRAVLSAPDCDGYYIRRKNFYRGEWIRRSGWWPDEVLRLFRRGAGRFSDRIVHESLLLKGKAGRLSQPLEHHSFASVSDFIRKADLYSAMGARQMQEVGRRSSPAKALFHAFFTFMKTYFLKLGFMDGRAGLLIAFSNAAGVFYRYMRCIELGEPRT